LSSNISKSPAAHKELFSTANDNLRNYLLTEMNDALGMSP